MALPSGSQLGAYEVVELLGAGGMGEVYRARDPQLRRDVAIKVLPVELSQDPDRLRRFDQEARAVAALNHPNILTVFHVGSHDGAQLWVFDLTAHTSRRITTHGQRIFAGVFDPTGRVIVTGDTEGVVRVGPVTGEEPHLLLGHTGSIGAVAASPDGRWIASAAEQVRLWPMPDVTKPPLHTLPHAELMAKLDALTNLRVVRDPASSTGWRLDIGPFPGWKDVPTW